MDFVNVPLLINALPYNVHIEHWPVVSSLFNMFQHILIQFFLVENFGKFLLISLKFQNKSTLTLPNNEKNSSLFSPFLLCLKTSSFSLTYLKLYKFFTLPMLKTWKIKSEVLNYVDTPKIIDFTLGCWNLK
jgi:hypothetical protein